MNELQIFVNKELGEIRALEINNEPWFVGKDVAKILGYAKPTDAVRKKVDEEDRGISKMETPSGVQEMTIINESGLYSLILSSKLPNAKKFKRWVTSEVLPQIRQTGGYIPYSQEESNEEILARALIIAQNTLDKKNKMIEEMQPKVNTFDKFMNAEGLYTSTQMAKLFKMSSAMKLNKLLNAEGLIYKQGNTWMPYATANKEWFKVIVREREGHAFTQLKFTPIGVIEIAKILNVELNEDDLID